MDEIKSSFTSYTIKENYDSIHRGQELKQARNVEINYYSNEKEERFLCLENYSSENILNENRRKYMNSKTREFLYLLRHSYFENGMENEASRFIDNLMEKNICVTREWINDIFIENYNNTDVAIKILYLIADYSRNDMGNNAISMAVMGLNHKDDMVKSAALKAIDHWNSIDMLPILKNIEIKTPWVENMLNIIVQQIENVCKDN